MYYPWMIRKTVKKHNEKELLGSKQIIYSKSTSESRHWNPFKL